MAGIYLYAWVHIYECTSICTLVSKINEQQSDKIIVLREFLMYGCYLSWLWSINSKQFVISSTMNRTIVHCTLKKGVGKLNVQQYRIISA